ncbi:MAG: MerR family transcriptional regulator [Polyangia bacterium]
MSGKRNDTLRMKDLCARTGLPRQAIHFYIREGLLPEGRKTGRNMAYYGEEHIERIALIRRLQEERFLPLRAIKVVLGAKDRSLSAAQQRLLSDVKQHLIGTSWVTSAPRRVALLPVCERCHITQDDARKMAKLDLVSIHVDAQGREQISESDVWLLESLSQLRAAGLSAELGFGPDDLLMFEEAIAGVFLKEMTLITDRLQHVRASDAAAIVQRVQPIVNQILTRLHDAKIRSFVSAL